MDVIRRYHNDPTFHKLITVMTKLIEEGSLSREDIVNAAKLACKISEEDKALRKINIEIPDFHPGGFGSTIPE